MHALAIYCVLVAMVTYFVTGLCSSLWKAALIAFALFGAIAGVFALIPGIWVGHVEVPGVIFSAFFGGGGGISSLVTIGLKALLIPKKC